jgi:transcriptional regulator with XRE-family HTH domain
MATCQVKEKLRQRGWRQVDLASRMGVKQPTISLLIKGQILSPYLQRLTAELLGENEERLWGDLWWYRRSGLKKLIAGDLR